MAGKSKKKIFFPQTRLTELVARTGGIPRDLAIDGAMQSLESMRGQADAEIYRSIAALEAIALSPAVGKVLDDGQMNAVLRHADQIVTLAGTFCHAALDTAARSLCDIADGLLRAGTHEREPIAVHVQTMHLLAPGNAALSPAHIETVLSELAKVAEHFNFGSLDAASGDDAEALIATR